MFAECMFTHEISTFTNTGSLGIALNNDGTNRAHCQHLVRHPAVIVLIVFGAKHQLFDFLGEIAGAVQSWHKRSILKAIDAQTVTTNNQNMLQKPLVTFRSKYRDQLNVDTINIDIVVVQIVGWKRFLGMSQIRLDKHQGIATFKDPYGCWEPFLQRGVNCLECLEFILRLERTHFQIFLFSK